MRTKGYEKFVAVKVNFTNDDKWLFVPSWLVSTVIVLWLTLPHIALRFSYLPIIQASYASLILLVFSSIFFVVLLRLRVQKKIVPVLLIFLSVALYGSFLGLSHGRTIFDVAKSAYELLAPIILLFLILLSRITSRSLVRSVMTPLLWVSFVDATYTIYQYLWVHHYQELWFYDPLTRMGNELSSWDYEISNTSTTSGNTVIRAPGIFTSPLENVYVISMTCIYFSIKTIKTNFLYAFPTSFYILIGYMTGVRTFFIGIFIAFLAWVFIEIKWIKKPLYLFIIIPFASIVATYLFMLINLASLDLSALGRLDQLNKVFNLLLENPLGYGFGSIGIGKDFLFDSVYGTWFVSLGLIGGVGIVYIYYWLSKQLLKASSLAVESNDIILLLTLILFSIDLAYISQFQYALMTPGRWYFVIAAAITLNRLRINIVRGTNNAPSH